MSYVFAQQFNGGNKFIVPGNIPIDKIKIFDNDGVVISASNNYTRQAITGFQLDSDLKKKNKENFSTKSPYLLRTDDKDWNGKTKYDLCIPKEMAQLEEPAYSIQIGGQTSQNDRYQPYAVKDIPCTVIKQQKSNLLNMVMEEPVKDIQKHLFDIKEKISDTYRELNHAFLRNDSPEEVDRTITKIEGFTNRIKELNAEFKAEVKEVESYTLDDFYREEGMTDKLNVYIADSPVPPIEDPEPPYIGDTEIEENSMPSLDNVIAAADKQAEKQEISESKNRDNIAL